MRYYLLLCLLFVAAKGYAEPHSLGREDTPFRVEDAVRLAVQNNPRLLAAAGLVRSARTGAHGAQALLNPSLVIVPATSSGGADEALILQQPLELNGTRKARAGIAKAELKRSEAEALSTLRVLVFDTKIAYYELVRAEAQKSLSDDLIKYVEELDRITRRLVELGKRPGIERTQTGIELARAQQQQSLVLSQVASAKATLNRLLGRSPKEPFGILALLPTLEEPSVMEEDHLIRDALSQSAEVRVEEATREVYEQQGQLARASGKPDLAPQFRAQSFRTGGDNMGFGIAITLPLFDHGSRRAQVQQSQEAARAQTFRITDTQNQVRQEVAQALARLQASESVVASYRQGILEQAKKLLDANRAGVEAGAYNLLAVLEAQRTYRTVQSDYLAALASLAMARAELERASGAVSETLLPDLARSR